MHRFALELNAYTVCRIQAAGTRAAEVRPMAKALYCWRCREVLPMLDEDEWAQMAPALDEAVVRIKRYRREHQVGLHAALPAAGKDAFDLYERLTGRRETSLDAIRHHRLALYGPPCAHCGQPLRTPRAKLCAACGQAHAPA